jgi:hypothetical protein
MRETLGPFFVRFFLLLSSRVRRTFVYSIDTLSVLSELQS